MTDIITSLKLKRDCNKVCIQLGPTGCPSRTSKELDFHLTVDENCCEGPKYCTCTRKRKFPFKLLKSPISKNEQKNADSKSKSKCLCQSQSQSQILYFA